MKKIIKRGIVVCITIFAVLNAQEAQKSQLKIGIVNIKKIFEDSLEAKDIKSGLEKEQKEMEKKILEYEKRMRELQQELEELQKQPLSAGSLTFSEKKKELATLKSTYEFEKQEWNQKIREKVNSLTLELYNKFRNIVEEYAIKNGFSLVLKVEEKELQYDPMFPTDERIRPRTVLYYKNELDITQPVIDEINKRYLEEKSKKEENPKK
jgi:Skp family chaperone for outer membrane proteins